MASAGVGTTERQKYLDGLGASAVTLSAMRTRKLMPALTEQIAS